MRNKCNALEPSWNHPPPPNLFLPWNLSLVSKGLGTTAEYVFSLKGRRWGCILGFLSAAGVRLGRCSCVAQGSSDCSVRCSASPHCLLCHLGLKCLSCTVLLHPAHHIQVSGMAVCALGTLIWWARCKTSVAHSPPQASETRLSPKEEVRLSLIT